MQPLDWIIVGIYSIASLLLGVLLTKKASEGMESYFASGRSLGWLLAGTSMAATAFSSDTPLLVTGIVRSKGIWGNWEIWALAISTMSAVFFFSKLWKRAGVLTEVELVELRYGGKPAAFLRGSKALYWGIFYNAFIMGAWPVTGLVKVMQETTGWDKATSIFFCMGLTTIYSCLSGFWGVILTDFFQFIIAMGGAFLLAFYAVRAAGGIPAIVEKLSDTGKLDFIPPATGHGAAEIMASPFGWFLGLILIQWWAWKNTDGGGIIVQRIASCKNERQATFATLWFNIAQYALRSWPWIMTALASLVLLPDLTDHERAYPRLIAMLLPTGWKGLMIASFFAAFMSTMSTHLNWGSSYFVNDFYKRFIKKDASERHYVSIARIVSVVLACAAAGVAFMTESIGEVFTMILNLTAAIGPVYLLRWFWWRINPWSEIAAMISSVPALLLRPLFFKFFHLPQAAVTDLVFMVVASAVVWVPIKFLTPPVAEEKLVHFARQVDPPGFWRGWNPRQSRWNESIQLWIAGTLAILLTATGPLKWILGRSLEGMIECGAAVLLWGFVAVKLKNPSGKSAPSPAPR